MSEEKNLKELLKEKHNTVGLSEVICSGCKKVLLADYVIPSDVSKLSYPINIACGGFIADHFHTEKRLLITNVGRFLWYKDGEIYKNIWDQQ
ncbi:hypothetical protein LCGC14_0196280 [marine sediment metagenome]|uniref:Uncharacterized protein n=1 Tax=marine sediment metagenome TaxID=412755 RepID=A0A0F9UKN8_9ZZZZ